jgi:hypothetical protein
MKRLVFLLIITAFILPAKSQVNKTDILQNLEKNQVSDHNTLQTATLKSSTRFFGAKDDLTSVISIIPSGSVVNILDSDSTYFHVTFEDNEGYILKKHAAINPSSDNKSSVTVREADNQMADNVTQPQQDEQISRFSYLENKYGTNMAARLNSGKIWKGMNSEMVKDSWGKSNKINRVINGNVINEEWFYNNTWLYFENSILKDWGPVSDK